MRLIIKAQLIYYRHQVIFISPSLLVRVYNLVWLEMRNAEIKDLMII